jgi:hypothetical protein
MLEVSHATIRHEYAGDGMSVFLTHGEQFDTFGLVRQTFDGKGYIGLADEADLEARPAFESLLLVLAYCLIR